MGAYDAIILIGPRSNLLSPLIREFIRTTDSDKVKVIENQNRKIFKNDILRETQKIDSATEIFILAHGVCINNSCSIELIYELDTIKDTMLFLSSSFDFPLRLSLWGDFDHNFIQDDMGVLKEGSVLVNHGPKSSRSFIPYFVYKLCSTSLHSHSNMLFNYLYEANQAFSINIALTNKEVAAYLYDPLSHLDNIKHVDSPYDYFLQQCKNFLEEFETSSLALQNKIDNVQCDQYCSYQDSDFYNFLLAHLLYEEKLSSQKLVNLINTQIYNEFTKKDNAQQLLLSPFYSAIYEGNRALLKKLLESGVSINGIEPTLGETPLTWAIKAKQAGVAEDLIGNGSNLSATNKNGFTPLYLAVQSNNMVAVELLIQHGAEVNQDVNGFTPVYVAAQNNFGEICSLLISAGANVTIDKEGFTPLYAAIKHNHVNIAEMLAKAGASINANVPQINSSLLHLAIYNGHLESTSFLIEQGADIEGRNPANDTPLLIAIVENHIEIVKKLLLSNVDINKGIDGFTPLYLSVNKGYEEIVTLLVNNGADLNLSDNIHGNSPLYMACFWGLENIVITLLQAGAEINKVTKLGITELQVAANQGHLNIVKTLINAGADVFAKTPDGQIAYDLVQYKHSEVSAYLKQYIVVNSYTNEGDFSTLFGLLSPNDIIKMDSYGIYKGGEGRDVFVVLPEYEGKEEGYKIVIGDFCHDDKDIIDLSRLQNVSGFEDLRFESVKFNVKDAVSIWSGNNNQHLVIVLELDDYALVESDFLFGEAMSGEEF